MNSEPRLLERARCTEHAHSVRRAAPRRRAIVKTRENTLRHTLQRIKQYFIVNHLDSMATAVQGPCHCQRRRSYKQMVRDIADNLGAEDVRQIVYLHDLPREFGDKSGLEVLQHLERRGEVRERETRQLENLLQEIHRFDLIEKHIVQYRRDVFCGCETRNTGRSKYT